MTIGHDRTMLTEAAHFMMVADSLIPRSSRPISQIISLPLETTPMAGRFVACVLDELSGLKADVDFDCPRMPDVMFRLIDSVAVVRKLSRRSNTRVVASRFVMKNPLAESDHRPRFHRWPAPLPRPAAAGRLSA
jgi:hypothetical protein